MTGVIGTVVGVALDVGLLFCVGMAGAALWAVANGRRR